SACAPASRSRRSASDGPRRTSGSSPRSGSRRSTTPRRRMRKATAWPGATVALVTAQVVAELHLVRGDVESGLAALDQSLTTMRAMGFAGLTSNALEPWTLSPLATSLAAYARYADNDERRVRGRELAVQAVTALRHLGDTPDAAIDSPVTGMGLAALGAWVLTVSSDAADVEGGVRLVAL